MQLEKRFPCTEDTLFLNQNKNAKSLPKRLIHKVLRKPLFLNCIILEFGKIKTAKFTLLAERAEKGAADGR